MKKLTILLIALSFFICGCRTTAPYTNFYALKKPVPENPSFLIFLEKEGRWGSGMVSWIEDTLTGKGLTVISMPVYTRHSKEYSSFNWWVGRETGQSEASLSSIDLSRTPATYLITLNGESYEFKIIKVQTHELISKGYLSRDYCNEILYVLKDMGIPVELPPPGPPQKNFWQRLLWPEEKTP